MDINNENGTQISDDLQFGYNDRIETFDANLGSSADYIPSLDANVIPEPTAIVPFHAIASNYVEQQSPEISMVTSANVPDNCITYSDVIFVPNHINAIELVKNEADVSAIDTHAFKYVLANNSRFVNTFIQSDDIDATGLDSNSTYIEQPSHVMTTISQLNQNDLIVNGIANGDEQIRTQLHETIDQNQITVQMQPINDQVIVQDGNGHLFRQVQNIYVDGSSMCSSELMPISASDANSYGNQNINRLQNDYQQQETSYQIPVTYVNGSETQRTVKSIDDNLQIQQVELIFNSYKNKPNDVASNESNQYVIESNSNLLNDKQVFQSTIHSDKDQHGVQLESTMSTLLAAVNDITARDEQIQSYLNSNKGIPDHSLDYYEASSVDNLPSSFFATPTKGDRKEIPKTQTLESITNDLLNGYNSPADEYVDINEMEFIEKRNDEGQRENKVLMRRSRRKKTTKRKEDELLVMDKFVPSRAFASLPTSYLYFESIDDPSNKEQVVLAKKDIPLHMKFGPFVGDEKTFNKFEIRKYRETIVDYPLLFQSNNTILDVSNENASNWMRFVRVATKYPEQNLLLCEIDSQFYFKCCKTITSKQELRVGYSKEYAKKYNLIELLPEKCDLASKRSKNKKGKKAKGQSVPRTTPTKSDSSSPSKSIDRLNTGAIRKRKLALSKNSRTSGPTVRYACCYCTKVFSKFVNYKKHTHLMHSVNIEHKKVRVDAQHKRLTVEDSVSKLVSWEEVDIKKDNFDKEQWFVCQRCERHFMTANKLEKHQESGCNSKETMSVQCPVCQKELQTPSALSMHIKVHNAAAGICKCPYCSERYQNTTDYREHVKTHMLNGMYICPHCPKQFPVYSSISKHIRINHTTVRFVCHECGKDFKSKYKLKEHSLSHSDFRQFSCDDCDKQFKRKDKLRDHIIRAHTKNGFAKQDKVKTQVKNETTELSVIGNIGSEMSTMSEMLEEKHVMISDANIKECPLSNDMPKNPTGKPKFQPMVAPTDYERFIYKCQYCMVGFKRRGMLINHMAKRHPDIQIESIPELTLPILKTERCFYCPFCEKVYKSSTKRKAHILKNHPGQKLPQSMRHDDHEDLTSTTSSYSENIGSIPIQAHQCMWCYKQYASRSRLLQHKRKVHNKELEDSYNQNQTDYFKDLSLIMDSHESQFQSAHINQIDDYAIKFNEMNEGEHSVHRYQIEYEPENSNRLLELSTAALEASIRDDYSFLSVSDVNNVDVNFKCDSNALPQLFEEIDCMSLKPAHFPNGATQIDIGKLNYSK